MKINRVTITGADDAVDISQLRTIQKNYPFVEWGVLFSDKRKGSPRYPSVETIDRMVTNELSLSAHFCGNHSREVMEKQNFKMIESLKGFKRVQINYNFAQAAGDWKLIPVLEWAKSNPYISLIFQANYSNTTALLAMNSAVHSPANIHYLYDSSGGRGVEIADLGTPFMGHYTGYSGGIHQGNIESIIKKVLASPFGDEVWLDMESGIRTEDAFDLFKVEEILHDCYRGAKIGKQL